MPSRMPKISDEEWAIHIEGGKKYRPTFIAILGSYIGMQPFKNPAPRKVFWGRPHEMGDRQNYTQDNFLCPSVPDWSDERNGAYGYNYQFLGNSRLYDSSDWYSLQEFPRQDVAHQVDCRLRGRRRQHRHGPSRSPGTSACPTPMTGR